MRRARDHQHRVHPGVRSEPNLLLCADQAAIVNFTRRCRRGDETSVRVNAVAPVRVDAAHPVDDAAEKVSSSERIRRSSGPAQPVEIAPLFVFLASNEARFVTGEVYGATGGQTPY